MNEDVAKQLEHIARGLRDGTLEVDQIDMSQTAMPVPGADGRLDYKPTGQFMLVVTYKRKDA